VHPDEPIDVIRRVDLGPHVRRSLLAASVAPGVALLRGRAQTPKNELSLGAGEGNRTLVCSLGSYIISKQIKTIAAKLHHLGLNHHKGLQAFRKTPKLNSPSLSPTDDATLAIVGRRVGRGAPGAEVPKSPK
jgi:hypothetical protein